MMNKRLGAACLAMGLLMAGAQASAQDTTYVFPYEGLRYTQREDETVLTQTNLDGHEALIEQLGTTKEAILASYIASGIVMEVIPDEGGQIAVSVADAGDYAGVAEMDELDEAALDAFVAQFAQSGLYESSELLDTQPVCVRLTSSAMVGSMPVYSLKYATLHLGRLYVLTQTIVGREPDEADDARMLGVLDGIQLLSTLPEATPEPTPVPTPEPTASPEPTPGVAQVVEQTGNIEVTGLPAYITQETVNITGTTDPQTKVTVSVGDARLGTATSKRDGSFSVRVTLPEEGDLTLSVATETAEVTLAVHMQLPQPRFEFVDLESTTFTGEQVLVRGKTVPYARVRVSGDGVSNVTDANKNGAFSLRLTFSEAGSKLLTFTVRADGYAVLERQVTFTRELTERERINAFRRSMIELTYSDLADSPLSYAGKHFSLRGRVEGFTDYDGSPCALVCVENKAQGEWYGPIWVVLEGTEGLTEGSIATFYLEGDALTLPADGAYTEDGLDVEAPVAHAVYCTDIK